MKRLSALVLALVGFATATAAEPAKPAIEFRLKSVVDLLPVIEYGADLAGQGNAAEQVTAIIKEVVRQKMGLKGVDLTKPVGGYVIVAENVADSPIVLMVPVASEDAFLGALEDDVHFNPKKEADGTYTLTVPNFPASLHLRFANGYGYVGFRSAAGVAKDKLLDPKDFFAAKQDAAFALNVFLDRIPADLRKVAYGQIELQLNDAIRATNPAEKALQKFLADRVTDMAKTALMDGEKLSLTLSADPKADDIALELTLTPKAGTTLAKTLGGWADRPSKAAGLAVNAKGAAAAVAINFGLPSETKAGLNKLIDVALAEALDKADGAGKVLMKQVADALLPTLRAGEFELGAALLGPNEKGKFGGVVGVRTEGGREIKKLAEALSVLLPESIAKIKFDVEKQGFGSYHTITSPALANPKLAADAVQLYTSEELFAATLAPDTAALKAMLAAKPAATPMFHVEASVVKLFRLIKDVEADKLAKMTEEAFGKPVRDGDDTIKLTVSGGKDFRLKLAAKGRALAFIRVANE